MSTDTSDSSMTTSARPASFGNRPQNTRTEQRLFHSTALQVAVRAVLILAAILFVATGVVVLTRLLDGPVYDRTLARSGRTSGLATFARLSAD